MAARKGSRHHKAKLTEKDVREIRRRRTLGHTLDDIWVDFPHIESYSTIGRVAQGATWRHI